MAERSLEHIHSWGEGIEQDESGAPQAMTQDSTSSVRRSLSDDLEAQSNMQGSDEDGTPWDDPAIIQEDPEITSPAAAREYLLADVPDTAPQP